jgi:hypothetical protein
LNTVCNKKMIESSLGAGGFFFGGMVSSLRPSCFFLGGMVNKSELFLKLLGNVLASRSSSKSLFK